MAMTRKFVDAVIAHGWEPIDLGDWMNFKNGRSGTIITFKGHEEHKYLCARSTAREILSRRTIGQEN